MTKYRASILVDVLSDDEAKARQLVKDIVLALRNVKSPPRGRAEAKVDYTDLVEIKELR